jgi:disintegrin and metalloproteinase domain-containing protein 17
VRAFLPSLCSELGHNFGAVHDPPGDECSPSGRNGGSYVMHTYSVQGTDPNNKLFSPCSIQSIRKVLEAKADLCFNGRLPLDVSGSSSVFS